MKVQVAANTNTNTDTNTLTNSNTNKSTIFCRFFSTASHQLGQNVAAWQEMEFEVATDDGEEDNQGVGSDDRDDDHNDGDHGDGDLGDDDLGDGDLDDEADHFSGS